MKHNYSLMFNSIDSILYSEVKKRTRLLGHSVKRKSMDLDFRGTWDPAIQKKKLNSDSELL